MRQLAGIGIGLAFCLAQLHGASARGQSPEELARTAAYAAGHQNPDGGFAPVPGEPSTLGATNTAIRILKYVRGSIPDVFGCIRFVRSCRTPGGGFSQRPGGTPDPVTTAVGLMASAELKIADQETIDQAIAYLGANAHSFEEVRMAIAGLEAVAARSPDFPRWAKMIEQMRRPDGTFGEGAAQAFATGGAAAAILRMGLKLENRDAVVKVINAGQRPDGGWSKDDGPADLASSYRVMRALYLLGEKPDLDRLLRFVDRCRQSDGSYAPAPGGDGNLSATYYATILIRWARLLQGKPPFVETAGFVSLFNGRDLTGWQGNEALWSARDGLLVGKSAGIDHNEFLTTTESYRDFVLSLSFRLVDGVGNSGIQFRSVRIPGTEMSGYQADIGENFWGCLYDESRRNKVLAPGSPEALEKLRKSDWNHYVIRAMGNRIQLYLNGVSSVDYREEDPSVTADGLIGLQIHAGGPMEIQFQDLMIQRLPSPSANQTGPGFHLRSLATDHGPRKYTVYVPADYDGQKEFPAVLFLHGAGERGDDGVVPSQVGIGPAIVQRPGGLPAIVVFPQARTTWKGGSEDSEAALQALEDVIKNYKVDAKRIILTGLSMGGMGSWDMAALHPNRFAAVVPVCGPGRPEDGARLKDLPIRAYVGDADSDFLHLGMRRMVEAVIAAGGNPIYTEYRDVGHNSWDRAYNDPELIAWMLSQRRP